MFALINVAAVSLTVSIAGAQGRLGRELVTQSLERGWNVRGIVRRIEDPVYHPVRRGWLDERRPTEMEPVVSPNLTLTDNATCSSDTNAIIFVMSEPPVVFSRREPIREQTDLVRHLCHTSRHTNCSHVCLVSAFGAGESLYGANAGYRVMHDLYLKDLYRAKEEQERIVGNISHMATFVLRPKVLVFEPYPLNRFAVVRSELATEILDWIDTTH